MDFTWIVAFLALVTLLRVLCYAVVGKERTELRRKSRDTVLSSLARDGDFHIRAL